MKKAIVKLSDTDENADWIKSLPSHKDELKIHEALAKKYGEKAPPKRKKK